MALVIGLVTFAGGAFFRAGYGAGDALLFGLNLALICAVFGGLALLISQFTQEWRRAAGITAGVRGLQPAVVLGFLAAVAVALTAGTLRFARKDVGR